MAAPRPPGRHRARPGHPARIHRQALCALRTVVTVGRRRRRLAAGPPRGNRPYRFNPPVAQCSEEHTSELQSLMRISYAAFCLKKKNNVLLLTVLLLILLVVPCINFFNAVKMPPP